MRRHICPTCSQDLFADNTQCLNCGTVLGFDPERGFVPLAPDGAQPCANRDVIACNWIAAEDGGLCRACLHTTVLPDLSVEGNAEKWAALENAKRAVLLSAMDLGLPLRDAEGEPAPVFEFKADPPDPDAPRVLTGHAHGVITLNVSEADDAERARMREAMGEPFRTLPGHFRHEIAHHYWEVLTERHPEWLERLRNAFDDEREDYGAALARHYADGPPEGWEDAYISNYATSHPWEDFAETWANVLHVLDGLETARAFDLVDARSVPDGHVLALSQRPMAELAPIWISFSIALNAVNQAMGHPSFYPFVLSPRVTEKMDVILDCIAALRR